MEVLCLVQKKLALAQIKVLKLGKTIVKLRLHDRLHQCVFRVVSGVVHSGAYWVLSHVFNELVIAHLIHIRVIESQAFKVWKRLIIEVCFDLSGVHELSEPVF